MLSQYSWWDFIKVVSVAAVIYYAFVAWKYYREDIREWISNRGQTPPESSQEVSDQEEEDDGSLYTTTHVSSLPTSQPPVATTASAPAPVQAPINQSVQQNEVDIAEGVVVGDEQQNGFELALAVEVVRPEELSIDDVLEAGKNLTVDQHGAVAATEPSDTKAAKLAQIVNQQQGHTAFDGIPFTR